MIDQIKAWFYKRKILDVQQFAHQHRKYMVIICDPKDDTIFVSFQDKQVCGRVASMDGVDHKVIKNVLKHSVFEREIDRFLGAIIDVLKCPLEHGDKFFQVIDAALWNITKALKLKKQGKYEKADVQKAEIISQ